MLLFGASGTNCSEIGNRNSNNFVQENALGNVVCKMTTILSRPQYVNCNACSISSRSHRAKFKSTIPSLGQGWNSNFHKIDHRRQVPHDIQYYNMMLDNENMGELH